MESRPGLDLLQQQLKEAQKEGGRKVKVPESARDMRYSATCATLLRLKRKVRVPPRRKVYVFDHDKLMEKRFPKNRGKKLDPAAPPAVPFKCDPECETCWSQFFPARIAVTDEEALNSVQSLTNSINTDIEYLRQALSQHADLIVSRWKKMFRTKRTEFLTEKDLPKPDDSSKPQKPRDDAIRLYESKYAAVHFINDHSVNPTKMFDTSPFAGDSVSLKPVPYVDYFLNEMALQEMMISYQTTWELYIDEIIFNMYRRYIWWRQTLKECRRMVDAYAALQQASTAKNRLEYEQGITCVWDVATESLVQQILLLDYSLPFQHGFERNYEYGKGTAEADGTRLPTIDDRDAFHQDKLFWSLKCLGFDEHRKFAMDPAYHFRVLDDHLSHSDRKEKARVSEALIRQVSEMAALEDIRTSITCSRSWTRELVQMESEVPVFREKFVEKYAQTLSLPEIVKTTQISQHLRTLCTTHQWPKGTKDNVWLQRAADSRKQLGRIWTAFRVALKSQQQRDAYPEEFIADDWITLSAADKPEHLQNIEVERRMILASVTEKTLAAAEKLTPSVLVPPTQRVNGVEREHFVALPVRSKKKTHRPQAESGETLPSFKVAHPPNATAEAAPAPETHTPRLFLKPENVNLFDSMFSTYKTQTRSYSWKHFLGAMADAGFAIAQSSGSAVSFKNAEGVIVFHRPHPEPNIDPILLMAMGKRLNKWFGFGKETFGSKKGDDESAKA